MQSNFKLFSDELDNLIAKSKEYKNTKKYESEILTFKNYLIDSNLKDKVLILTEDQVNGYFLYCQSMNKLGSKSTLNTHISALKCIFEYLIDRGLKYNDLFGSISTQDFRNKTAKRLRDIKRKELISIEDIKLLLERLSQYFVNNIFSDIGEEAQQEQYIRILVTNLYIRLNLILPLKVSEMLDITFKEFSSDFRQINYNGFQIRLPNSLHNYIIDSIKILNNSYKIEHTYDDNFFEFFAKSITDKFDTSKISSWVFRSLKHLGINLNESNHSKTFPVEKFKKTAIWNMINNGINVIYLSDLTGLSLPILAGDNIFDYDNTIANCELNGICNNLDYYQYL